jgi:ribosomal protein L11 methyltransferase
VIALVLTVPAGEAELAADALWALGVQAVEERPADPSHPDVPTEDHFVQLWTSLGDDRDEIRRAAEAFPARWRWHTEDVADDVVDSWRRHAVATWVTPDVVVVPAWVPTEVPDGAIALRIDPGAAFGLGDHPTTVLTLRALRELVWPDATVLDVGCGSGVLSVGAVRFGASYVEAIDVSPAAVEATIANAERNAVQGSIAVSTRPLAEVDGPFDVVLANILAHTLIDLAGDLRRVTATSGVLVVSGILDGAYGHVEEALAPMQVTDRLAREGWAALVLRH